MRDRCPDGTISLRVNPVLCDGVGMCAQFAPDLIEIDQWGFPLFPRRPLNETEQAQAMAAVRGCPKRALLLDGPAEPV
jgi:ferredoxin